MSAGRFATKTGANDSTDLQYDSLSETGFHENELDNSAANFLASRATISPRAVGWRIPQDVNYRDGEHRGLSLPGGDGGVD